jgi:hypothetical protein
VAGSGIVGRPESFRRYCDALLRGVWNTVSDVVEMRRGERKSSGIGRCPPARPSSSRFGPSPQPQLEASSNFIVP